MADGADEDLLSPVTGDGVAQLTAGPIGTPGYLSPEQARGEPSTPASDTYSLGAVLYALLTGRPPIDGENVVEVLERTRRHEFPPARAVNPTVHPALEAVCAGRWPLCRTTVTRTRWRWRPILTIGWPTSRCRPGASPIPERVRRWASAIER